VSGAGKPGGGATPQGLGAQGPGNAHGVPAAHERDVEDKPFDPAGGQPAEDVQAKADALLQHANKGPSAGNAGPEAAGGGKPTG
jgi:hypothetical protein